MTSTVTDVIDSWSTVSLTELNRRAALLDRAENKYVIGGARLALALTDMERDFDVLSIEGRTQFTYDTVYFDDPLLGCFRHHVQGRRRRMKVRSRRYVDSDAVYFEVKLKGLRGRTIKERMTYAAADHGCVTPKAAAFLSRCTSTVYGHGFEEPMQPALGMSYRRITLVARRTPERVTIDTALEFRTDTGACAAPQETTIVEVKSPDGRGLADRTFREHGIRGQSCSKYCVGLTLLHDDLPFNPFSRTLRANFAWKGPAPMTPLALAGSGTASLLAAEDRELLERICRSLPVAATKDRDPALVEQIVVEEINGFHAAQVRSYLEILVTRAVVARLRADG
jgi:hypothetical protein